MEKDIIKIYFDRVIKRVSMTKEQQDECFRSLVEVLDRKGNFDFDTSCMECEGEGYAEDYAEGYVEGFVEGYAEECRSAATKMMEMNLPEEIIIRATGLTSEQLATLRQGVRI